MFKNRLFLITVFLCLYFFSTAQEWEYLIKKEATVVPGKAWVSGEEKIFLNVAESKRDKNNKFSENKYVLAIDYYGKYAGSMKLNSCNSKTSLLPLNNNQLLATGINCNENNGERIRKNELQTFDYQGNLKQKGDYFGNFNYAIEATNQGYVSIRKEEEWEGKWTICEISENLKITEHPIDISSLLIPNGSLSPDFFNFMQPVWLNGTDLVIPFKRVEYNPKQTASRKRIGSLLVKLNKDKIHWHYPEVDSERELHAFQQVGEDFAIVMGKNFGIDTEYILLDKNGKVKKKIPFQVGGFFQKMLVHNDEIFMVSTGKRSSISHCLVSRFDSEMNLLETRTFYDQEPNMAMVKDLIPLNDNSILMVGSVRVFDGRPEYTFIRKLNLQPETEEIMEEEESEAPAIESISLDEIGNAALVVSVFPNPATIDINIQLKEGYDSDGAYLLHIFSSTGQTIQQQNFSENPLKVNIAELPVGTYIYRVERTDRPGVKVVMGKFIKV